MAKRDDESPLPILKRNGYMNNEEISNSGKTIDYAYMCEEPITNPEESNAIQESIEYVAIA